MFILAHNTCCSFPSRIDIQHHVRQFRRDPREEDGRKLENLRTSLVPLLAQLTRLQVASGVYECAQSQTTPRNYSLEEWDILDETPDQERPDGEATSAQTLQSAPDGSAPGVSAPRDTTLPIELQTIGLPSNKNVTPGYDHLEIFLRKNQAKTHLNHLRELIAEKSFQYSDLIRGAPRKRVVTRARGTVKGINMRISFHSQVYSQCRSRLIHLGADTPTLQQFRELKRQDIRASTAILTPNEAGSTTLELSWIWHDVARHILPRADADFSDNPATILECILFSLFSYILWLRYFQSGVSIGFVPEHRSTGGMRSVRW
jgi:hypothetical protein